MYDNKKIGIFGGSFDPPHEGHVKICKISLKKLGLKKVYWIVANKNPLKRVPFYSIKQRILKSKKLTKKQKKIEVLSSNKELKSSRTISIINYFIKKRKQKNLYLILGSDSLINFHKWTSWKKIVKMSKLVVFSRKGYVKKSKESKIVKYLKKQNIIYINNKLFNISSTMIRRRLKNY